MQTKTFHIPNISCGHCVKTIKNELEDLEGIAEVKGDPDKKEITVDWDHPASLENILETLAEINYPAQD